MRGYDSQLIMQEIGQFNVKNDMQKKLGKCMDFAINNNLVLIDRIQLMSSSLDVLVKNLADYDFRHLSQEITGEYLKLVKQKEVFPYE